MRFFIDKARCTRCGACLKACPQKPKSFGIFDCDNCEDCLAACPKNAILNAQGVLLIDPAQCNNCGDCVKICPKKAILPGKKLPAKCDFCYDRPIPRCIEACPRKAIRVIMDEREKKEVEKLVGWEKIDFGQPEQVLSDRPRFAIARFSGKKQPVFSVKIQDVSYEEACLVDWVVRKFRETNSEFDPALVSSLISQYCDAKSLAASQDLKKHLLQQVEKEINGLFVLDELIANQDLEEIAVLANQPIRVFHKNHGWLETDVRITNEKKIVDVINKLSRRLGRRVTLQKPRLNANLECGRVHAAIPPVSQDGPCLTIRKFREKPFSPSEMIQNNTISAQALAFLWLAVQSDVNILVCGNTGSGKTTLLNLLLSFVPASERIILVEETPEIRIPHQHKICLSVCDELKIQMHELVTDTLRMRPDRVVVGEVRNPEETRALFNTMLAGQGKSSFATFHAQDSREALARMQSFGTSPADLLSLDLIVVQKRWTKHDANSCASSEVRRVTEISSMQKDAAAGGPRVKKIFEYDAKKDALALRSLESDAFEKICFSFGSDKNSVEKKLHQMQKELVKQNAFFPVDGVKKNALEPC